MEGVEQDLQLTEDSHELSDRSRHSSQQTAFVGDLQGTAVS